MWKNYSCFSKLSFKGKKSKDFLDFCKIVDFMKNKVYLTSEGIKQIEIIKSGINRGRINN